MVQIQRFPTRSKVLKPSSRESSEPVAIRLVSLEHLFAEFLVASGLDSVNFQSVRVGVNIMLLSEDVRDWIESSHDTEDHRDDNHSVRHLVSSKEGDVFSDVVSHLRGGGRSSIVVLDHTVVKLRRHSDNHMIIVWVEVSAFRHINAEWCSVMVTSEKIVWVVGHTWLHSTGLGELGWPHTHVGSLGLMDSEIWWPDSVMDLSLAVVPLLEVVTSVLLMAWMHFRKVHHKFLELHLFETFVHKEIVLLMHSTVAARAGSAENLESSSQSTK